MSTEVGDLAPDFTLSDQKGQPWRLSEHRGKVVALIFYPKDETPVCTAQMCSVRDNWKTYQDTGAEVVGVSVGSVSAHQRFADHHDLPQRLLADERAEVTALFALKTPIFGTSKRAVVVIDRRGVIRAKWSTFPIFRPKDAEVLEAIRKAL
jgi:peroxiredoxin Q/BCP